MVWIGGVVVLVGALIFWQIRRPKTFSYKGRSYARHSDGSYTYGDGGFVPMGEVREVEEYWESTSDNSSSDSSDSGSSGSSDSGGGGDGGGGGGGD